MRIADSWGVRRGNADLVPHLAFAITDLRNAVAHNGVVFDTRFASATIRKKVAGMLAREMGFEPALRLGFDTITDYLVLARVSVGRPWLPQAGGLPPDHSVRLPDR